MNLGLVIELHLWGNVHILLIFWITTMTNKITSYQYN